MTPKQELKALCQARFVKNEPFNIRTGWSYGRIEYIQVTPVLGPQSPHFAMKKENGVWYEYGKPLDLGKVRNTNWSVGCRGLNGWIMADNLTDFRIRAESMLMDMIGLYINQLNQEKEHLEQAIHTLTLTMS